MVAVDLQFPALFQTRRSGTRKDVSRRGLSAKKPQDDQYDVAYSSKSGAIHLYARPQSRQILDSFAGEEHPPVSCYDSARDGRSIADCLLAHTGENGEGDQVDQSECDPWFSVLHEEHAS